MNNECPAVVEGNGTRDKCTGKEARYARWKGARECAHMRWYCEERRTMEAMHGVVMHVRHEMAHIHADSAQ